MDERLAHQLVADALVLHTAVAALARIMGVYPEFIAAMQANEATMREVALATGLPDGVLDELPKALERMRSVFETRPPGK